MASIDERLQPKRRIRVYRLEDGRPKEASINDLRSVCDCGNVFRVCHERYQPSRRR